MQGHKNRITDLFNDAETLDAESRFMVYAQQFLGEYLVLTERPIIITAELNSAVIHLYNHQIDPEDAARQIASYLGVETSQPDDYGSGHEEDND